MQLEETPFKRIVIFCGGPFSFPTIGLLAFEKFLAGIVIATQEPTVARSMQQECEKAGFPFLSLTHKSQTDTIHDWLVQVQPDAVFSICFPYLIPEKVLGMENCHFINFHTGPLPAYRGPMPIFEVIRDQETVSAMTAHMMDATYDSGAIIYAEEVALSHGETFTSLAQKLSDRCALMALNVAQMIQYGNSIFTTPQDAEHAQFRPFPELSAMHIDWHTMTAKEIIALINAGNGWNNGAITSFNGEEMHLITVHPDPLPLENPAEPGTLLALFEDGSGEIACIQNEKILVRQFGTEDGVYSYAFLMQMGLPIEKYFVN